MPGTRVTCTDIDTGDTETRVIENDSPGRAGMALVAAALYLVVCLFVAGLGYVLHLIAGFVWPGYPLETWQTIAATFGIWILGGLLFTGARS